jgi:hypothetical protein
MLPLFSTNKGWWLAVGVVQLKIEKKKNYSVKTSRTNLSSFQFLLHPNHPILMATAVQNPSGDEVPVKGVGMSLHAFSNLTLIFTETHTHTSANMRRVKKHKCSKSIWI